MSNMKPNRWVSIQSVLAEEEDRQQQQKPVASVPASTPVPPPEPSTSFEIKVDQDQEKATVPGDLVEQRLRHRDLAGKRLRHEETKTQYSLDATRLSPEATKTLYDQLPHYRTFNVLDDEIMPTLPAIEQVVLRRLVRLSYGFNRQVTDPVSINKLAEKCNLGTTAVKKALASLESRELITRYSDNSRNPAGGNRYAVLTKTLGDLVAMGLSREESKPQSGHIKDHDDLKITSHHLSETMRIYQSLTGNNWTKADQAAYKKIATESLERIEQGVKRAFDRAASHPGSFAYFTKEILNPSLSKSKVNERQSAKLRQIIEQVREARIGVGSEYTAEHFRQDVERACGREQMIFDYDLFNEIIGK
jgi:DNA-binding MarR family transcriptional regulator